MSPFTVDNLSALSVQAGVVALVGAPLPRLLGIRSPRARLAYWRALLVACLLLPFIQPLVPRAQPPLPQAGGLVEQVVGVPGTAGGERPSSAPVSLLRDLGVLDVIFAGIVARGLWFVVGLATLGRLRRRASRLDPRPGSIVDAIGLARADADFRQAPTPGRPVTFGLLHPVVIVPSDFGGFGAGEQKAIACHELIHVRRRDWARNIGDELVRAAAWFHPAAWWLTRQVRLAREQVVDQEVVRQLGARKPYLDALLRLASPDRGSVLVPAPLFLGRSHLADRVALLMKEVHVSRPRLVLSFAATALVLFGTGFAAVAAFPLHSEQALAPGATASSASAGAPAQDRPLARPALPPELKQAPRKLQDVRPAFPAGSPEVPVILSLRLDAAGTVADVTPVEGPADLAAIATAAVRQWRFSPAAQDSTLMVGFNPSAAASDMGQPAVLVGNTVRPPAKVKDVKPVYPADAQEARAQGVVILETRMAADGSVAEARILRSVPMLDRAAMAAVLKWKFTAPGFPVQMTVTVNFTLQGGPSKATGGVRIEGGVPGGIAGGVPGGVAGGAAGGVAGGMAGGVEGGVVGGVAGGVGNAPVRVGGNIKPPAKTYDVKPVYPQEARDAGVQGVVIVEIKIGPDGKVMDAKILRSIPLLDEAALEAVRQWEFEPTLLNGAAVPVIMTVTVNFTLQ